MAGHRKGPATFYLQPLPFSGDRKWPETESSQRKEATREQKGLEKRELNGLSKVWLVVLDFRRLGHRVCVRVCPPFRSLAQLSASSDQSMGSKTSQELAVLHHRTILPSSADNVDRRKWAWARP
jgi:hypothetical protein